MDERLVISILDGENVLAITGIGGNPTKETHTVDSNASEVLWDDATQALKFTSKA
jgi:hypothetical protein